jgi:hypothetical protein
LGEAHLVYKVVLNLAADVQGKGHVISIDNFLTFVGLSIEANFGVEDAPITSNGIRFVEK